MYCGILPYLVIKGEIYLLLGYEPRGYSEFGGTAESNNYIREAIREFDEETHGLFSDLIPKITLKIIYSDRKAIVYTFQLPNDCNYDCRIQSYNNTTNFLLSRGVDNILGPELGLFEKHYLVLFHLDKIPLNQCSFHFKRNYPKLKAALEQLIEPTSFIEI